LVLVVFGAFFALNLVLAEIMNSITTLKEEERAKKVEDEKIRKKAIILRQEMAIEMKDTLVRAKLLNKAK
jgi:hypothetical protein